MTAFLLAVGLIFATSAACGSLAGRLRLPRVVGEMGAGLVLGQSLLAHVWPRAENYLFSPSVIDAIKPLGLLVVLLYVAVCGAEIDRGALRGRSWVLVGAGAVGLAAATGGGPIVGGVLSGFEPDGVPRWTYYAFLTGALLVTAVPVLARILDETELTATRVGTVTLTLSVADDFIAFSIVAVAIAVGTHGSLALAIAGSVILAVLALTSKFAEQLRSRFGNVQAASAIGIGILAL